MTITLDSRQPLVDMHMNDLDDFTTAVEVHVLGVLNQDLRAWVQLLAEAARGETLIPRSKLPHMHPDAHVPCMFCAANVSDIHTVSAAIILSLNESRNIDDMWNAETGRSTNSVMREAQKTIIDDAAMANMFGEHWGMVISLGYRIEMADAPELVSILRDAVSRQDTIIAPRVSGRDYSHTARWLVSSAMSGKRESSMASRMRQRGFTDRLSAYAALVAREGNPEGTNSLAWMPVTRVDAAPLDVQKVTPTLRVVR